MNPEGELSFRLPTSTEWCYAAAAGLPTAYAGGDEVDAVAWSAQNAGSKLHAVASLAPNRWGLYDMSGSLWEWCEDGARDAEASAGDPRVRCVSPRQPKWLLGGSWANHPWVFPLGERLAELPTYADDFMGVRVARTLPPSTPALALATGEGGLALRPAPPRGAP
jgi:formylglycine-generating enzyme required for sulfatase activity